MKNEKQPDKPNYYSKFRRNNSIHMQYSIDVDMLEIRGRKIVAITETTSFKYKEAIPQNVGIVKMRSEFQREVIATIAKAMHVPAFYVIHDDDCTIFYVYALETFKQIALFSADEYLDFLSII